jgi:excisionase family DNA binding protein
VSDVCFIIGAANRHEVFLQALGEERDDIAVVRRGGLVRFGRSSPPLAIERDNPIPCLAHEQGKTSILAVVSMADSTAEQPEFLTVSQIAKRLQMSPQTVRTWIEEGMLRGIRVRKVWRVPREDFEQLLASLESGPPAPAGGWEERTPRRGFVDPDEAQAR